MSRERLLAGANSLLALPAGFIDLSFAILDALRWDNCQCWIVSCVPVLDDLALP